MSGTTPLWTDTLQALTSMLTAFFTLGSLLFLKRYTETTDKNYEETVRADQESLRPVLVLIDVKPFGGNRIATWKNTGGGLAVNVHLRDGVETMEADDNVLAPGDRIRFILPLMPDQDFLEMHYKSLSGTALGTLAYFIPDGSTFNHYVTDEAEWAESRLLTLRSKMKAHASDVRLLKLSAKQQETVRPSTGTNPPTP